MDRYAFAVLQLVGVILVAMALVSLLVSAALALLRWLSRGGRLPSVWWLIGLRMLTGYREAAGRRGPLARLMPVSTQNFIAMVGTALGVWALVVVLSVMGGFDSDLRSKIVKQSPHISVGTSPDVTPKRIIREADSIGGVDLAEGYIRGEALLVSDIMMMPGTELIGVGVPGRLTDRWLRPFADSVTLSALTQPVLVLSDRELGFGKADSHGKSPATLPSRPATTRPHPGKMPPIPMSAPERVPPGIVLGEELARTLGVGPGDRVTVVIPRGDVGPTGMRPRTRTFLVAGTFLTGLYQYDLKRAFIDLKDALRLYQTTEPNEVAVFVKDFRTLRPVAATLSKRFGSQVEVTTVLQSNRALFSALKVEKLVMFIVLGLVILVAAFNVFGSLLLVTIERVRDVAVLKSLGARSRAVGKVLLSTGLAIGGVGTIAGLVLGLASCEYIKLVKIRLPSEYYLRYLPVLVDPAEVGLIAAVALCATVVAALYPAASAARVLPAMGLRND